ncbi:MAG: leucyl/phenylalanyl-tRNA--protein transferase [Thermodesulfovibrio sp.]|nr:leucyl/phenylalanyl-tRNA--protein transferase [Thermodesulfovibrio sp.]MCX7724564.1 leucyl/phenylalanyl-tRNA--protein transferase [Thermodesulfovibrio sp.]MDW7972014.1 leucyl/phenylalanyl-tRNA--protein transferase [Thermodesulfovibrio sp.]
MTVYLLHDELIFPDPENADPNGLLAIGGDLSPERLILAYKSGIFPWYNHKPILWWSPSKRPLIFPRLFKMSRSLYQTLKRDIYKVSFDKDFSAVIKGCATAPRRDSTGTWITPEMIEAYTLLHELGFAHSVEVWFNGKLVGGLYGISMGKAFFGESMFTLMKDASKVAMSCLVEYMILNNFHFIDCQVTNEHLLSLGAYEIPRSVFLILLKEAIEKKPYITKWDTEIKSTSNTAKFLKERLIPRKGGV